MSVLNYLQSRSSQAVLSTSENDSIQRSIVTLKFRAAAYFGTDLKQQVQFGSSTRGTILPRSMDIQSDIDYMIVFTDTLYKPQTYLDRLQRFVTKYYSASEIYQSHPTITLELNHIRFELVPAIDNWLIGLQIPAPASNYQGWMNTDPNGFNRNLETKNKSHSYLVKPAIRLAKYWNAQNGYVFSSYLFEQWIVNKWFWSCTNLKDYLFSIFDELNATWDMAQWRQEKLQRAKQIIANVRTFEQQANWFAAEAEIKKMIPAA